MSPEHLSVVRMLAADMGATAVFVCDRSGVLASVGEPNAVVHCRSIRKSMLGALFGRHVHSGLIDLDATLGQLGIDDAVPPHLAATERTATIRDLLTCRSGIYHPANHAGDPRRSPACRPGAAIRRARTSSTTTGTSTPWAPSSSALRYAIQPWSEHRTYAFYVSARDLARLGQLYLNQGNLDGRVIIPPGWVRESTRVHTARQRRDGNPGPGYGYLWWVARQGELFAGTVTPGGSFAAIGNGGQFLLVVPAIDRVIALLADPARPGGTDATPQRRAKLAQIVHHATEGALPLRI